MLLAVNGKHIQAERGTVLSTYLSIDKPCGGKAKCGKCKVIAKGELSPITEKEKGFLSDEEIEQGIRLACMTKLLGKAEVFTRTKGDTRVATDGQQAEYVLNSTIQKYGVAVDIGTTTLVVGLYSSKGVLLGKKGSLNPQTKWGADVVSRIEKSLAGEGAALKQTILQEIEKLTSLLCIENEININEIDGAVITGNTAMLYLLTQTPVDGLARMPFSLNRPFGEIITAKELGESTFSPDMKIYLPPCISPFIGADTVCALLATSFWKRTDKFMLVDIGTNGEMVLFDNGRMYACSTAAGPAFEGAGLSCGMRGEDGAIEHIIAQDGKLHLQIIGDTKPKGICGSGVIDAVACLLEIGKLDETGYIEEDIRLCDCVWITKKDVREVQLAKGAIYAGLMTLLKTKTLKLEEINEFLIAGGFGGYIDLKNAGEIRLIPEEWVSRTRILGNAAYNGAEALLLDMGMRERCAQVIENVEVVELSTNPIFMEEYSSGMVF